MIGRRNSFDRGFSLERWLTAPFRWVRRLVRYFARDDSFAERGANPIVGLLTYPFRLVAGVAVFLVSGWAVSRSMWAFIVGLPALFGIVIVALGALAFIYLSPRNYYRYHGNGVVLLQAKDYANAIGFIRKACVLRFPDGLDAIPPDEKEWIVDLGEAVYRDEDIDRAMELIETVSPTGQIGNFRGHLWIASHLLGLPNGPTPVQLHTIKQHLDSASRQPDVYSDDRLAEFNLNWYYLAYHEMIGDPEQGIANLQRMWELDPVVLPEYLRKLKDRDRPEEFQAAYRDGMTRLNEMTSIAPNAFHLWRAMAESALVGEAYEQGLQVLNTGLNQVTDPQARINLTAYTSSYFMQWFQSVFSRDDEKKFKLGTGMLSQAMRLNPNNPDGLKKSIELLAGEPWTELQTQWVVEIIDEPQVAGAVIQVMAGVHALLNDPEHGAEKARSYWSIAQTHDVRTTSRLVCNLALTLQREHPEQAAAATQMLDLAINNAPSLPLYRLAKGTLLVELENWADARVILEEMLAAGQRDRAVLGMLVQCAKEMNDAEALADYERQLNEL